MKLSVIVRYLNQIDSMLEHNARQAVSSELEPLHHLITTHDVQYPNFTKAVDFNMSQVHQTIERFDKSIINLRTNLLNEIGNLDETYFAESYRIYKDGRDQDSVEYILKRRLALSSKSEEFITGRLKKYSDWRHPGMVLRPGLEPWVDMLVGLDPLYLVDQDLALFHPIKDKFNQHYLERLRMYMVEEIGTEKILRQLPDHQFGFVLAYNYFNYKPIEVITQYLTEMYQKLKPGGIFAFTFNNCENAAGVELVERSYMCYTPAQLVHNVVKSLNYEVEIERHLDASNTWLEIKKPGTLNTLRGGQALAKIVDKSLKISNNNK